MTNESADLKRYEILMAYLAYENTIYWGRTNLILVAEAALLGFTATIIAGNVSASSPANAPSPSASWSLERTIVVGALSLAGFILAIVWHKALVLGNYWINHWHQVLLQLEEVAFPPNVRVLRDRVERGADEPIKGERIKDLAYVIGYTFLALWVVLLVVFILHAFHRAHFATNRDFGLE
jgi:hypothetical protein